MRKDSVLSKICTLLFTSVIYGVERRPVSNAGYLSVFANAELAVQGIHADGIEEDQSQEGKYRALLREPESERVAADPELVEEVHQQDAAAEGNAEPDEQASEDQSDICLPVVCLSIVHCLPPPSLLLYVQPVQCLIARNDFGNCPELQLAGRSVDYLL